MLYEMNVFFPLENLLFFFGYVNQERISASSISVSLLLRQGARFAGQV